MIPGYWRGMLELQERDKRAHDWIQMFRDECKMISNKLFDYAIKNRMNIVWNGTGKNITKYNKLISVANKRGYIIELNGIWVPIELAKRRISKRRDSYGRPVPEKILNLAAINVPSCFKKLKKDKKVLSLCAYMGKFTGPISAINLGCATRMVRKYIKYRLDFSNI